MAFKLRDKQKVQLKIFFCSVLFIVAFLAITTQALAGGWIYVSKTHKPSADKWGSSEVPHGGFSANTNKCRVCHSLHRANTDSFKLLFDNSKGTACDRCHSSVSGLSGKKPYRLFSKYQAKGSRKNYNRNDSGKNPETPTIIRGKKIILRPGDIEIIYPSSVKEHKEKPKLIRGKGVKIANNTVEISASSCKKSGCHTDLPGAPPDDPNKVYPLLNAKGEHTIGEPNTEIPGNGKVLADGLSCSNCHDVHFSENKTIQNDPRWKHRGLLKDPGENGGNVESGFNKSQGPTLEEVRTAFCADCHTNYLNWSNSDGQEYGSSHVVGKVDGKVNVYGPKGEVKEVVNSSNPAKLTKSCMSCHRATTELSEDEPTDYPEGGHPGGPSAFPHQSVGHKLLGDEFDTESPIDGFDYTGKPKRPIPKMDDVCRDCHEKVGLDSKEGF